MSTIATGIFKKLTFKKQASLGTIATGGAATGQALRRTTSTLDLAKSAYKSAEIRPSAQRSDNRHGIRSVAGAVNGELSPGTYQSFFESACRQLAQAAATSGPITTVAAAITTAPQGTFTRSAGSFLTDGFMVGDIVSMSGWTTTGTANNAHNFMVLVLTATVMTALPLDGNSVAAKVAGDSVTIVTVGKKTWVPVTGQTRDYYTVEHNFSDIVQSEQFTDVVVTGFNVKMPPTGMITVSFPMMGLNMTTGTGAYFTSPTAATTTKVLASANGVVVLNGVKVGIVTSVDATLTGNYTTAGGVVGANVEPDIFPGAVDVSGTATILFDSATYRDLFVNETEAGLMLAFTTDNTPGAGVVSIVMSRCKFNSATKDDGEKGLQLTVAFVALENVNGGTGTGNLDTTISIQDSAFV